MRWGIVLMDDWLEQIDGDTLVLVATSRLLKSVQHEYAVFQQNRGNLVWESPRVYTWYDFLAEQYRLWSRRQEHVPLLLSAIQERLLWQEALGTVIRSQTGPSIGLMDQTKASKTAQGSYMMMQEWHIAHQQLQGLDDQDGQLFAVWITEFKRMCEASGWTNAASMNAWALKQLSTIESTSQCLWLGFDLFTPAQQCWRELLVDSGMRHAEASVTEAAEPEQITKYSNSLAELTAVFSKCRTALEQNQSLRLAVVVPRLEHLLPQARRAARQVFYPAVAPLALQSNHPIYEFSLGESLGDQPLVAAALNLIAALGQRLRFDQVIKIFDCPWSAIGTSSINSKLIRGLRRYASSTFTLSYLQRQLASLDEFGGAPEEFNCLVKIQADLPRKQSPDLWRQVFSSVLDGVAWGQTCELDSTEFQQKEAWEGVLGELSCLGNIKPMLEFSEALQLLRELSNAPFQIQSSNAALQIMGTLEMAGQTFDRVWLTGLNEQDWPGQMQPYPFVPAYLQQLAGVPEANLESFYTKAQKISARIIAASKNVSLSFSGGKDELSVSRLLSVTESRIAELPGKITQAPLTVVTDSSGPTYGSVGGGSQIFTNQSKCPFKAYVTHRLGAVRVQDQPLGFDTAERGTLVHRVLERFWQVGDVQQDLIDEATVEVKLERAVDDVLEEQNYSAGDLRGAQLELERERLKELIHAWLKVERSRKEPFTINDTEKKFSGSIFGIDVNLSLDRVDHLDDGNRLVIDYKTGKPVLSNLFSERPEEPQLLLYQVALDQQDHNKNNTGIGYGVINVGKPTLAAVLPQGQDVSVIGGRKSSDCGDWTLLSQRWISIIELFAEEFNAGHAAITPSKNACRYCDLKAVCRIQQSLPEVQA
ncbi:MAG: PD-(D/E)XK nuclease family protein [Arenicellaceae bacterium]|nr:PD-(D/E)XK nuclease family protein [Arenicellaceae bacterium]